MNIVYKKIKEFKHKYPLTISWRLKKHAHIIDMHLHDDEKVLYAFAAQKSESFFDIITTNAIVLTDKRLLIGTKRVMWGYFFTSITPELFNDFDVKAGLFYGKINIDTVKERIKLSNIDKRAIPEISSFITSILGNKKRELNSK